MLSRPSLTNSGLKPISSSSPLYGAGSASRASPRSGVSRDDQLPLAEGEPKGSVALGELRDPPGHLGELGPGQLHLVLVGLEEAAANGSGTDHRSAGS